MDGAVERERRPPVSRISGAAGEAVGTGPEVRESANGERRVVSLTPMEDVFAGSERQGSSQAGGFTSVNQ